ncbi:MAG: alpha-L-rhamnosidase [Clostridiales bacterium]|nr:alpha-L-rhamnosidase [Clostridiales bacterium]
MKLTEKFTDIRPFDTDPRTRIYLRPTRIVKTEGEVINPEGLLENRVGQISFDPSGCTILKNSGGKHAMVLIDLGREIHGSLRILKQSSKPERATINVRFGESVSEALTPTPGKGSTNDHANRDFNITLPASMVGTDTNETGYRFVAIELVDDNAELAIKALEGVLIVRDIEYVGSFECNDETINKIYNTAAYTAHLNMQEYMWDGIKRDRLVWIGDMHPEVMTICSVFGDNEVVARSLDSVRDVTPVGSWMNGIPSYSLWWIMCQYEYYMQNGNLSYLKEQESYLEGLIPVLCGLIDENGSEKIPDWRFLDWPTNDDPIAKHCGLQGLLSLALQSCEYLSKELGNVKLAELCRGAVEKLGKHIPELKAKSASALLALSKICDAEKIDREIISPIGARGYSTFYSYYILAAKALAGNTTGALSDMREYYGAMLKLGATTFWEDFSLDWTENDKGEWDAYGIDEIVPEGGKDIHGDFGAYCYVGLRHSLCHGWSSGPVAFLTRHVLGIKVLEAGCKRLEIKPDLCGLEYVRGSFPTPFGKVSVYADKSGKLEIDAPKEIVIEQV